MKAEAGRRESVDLTYSERDSNSMVVSGVSGPGSGAGEAAGRDSELRAKQGCQASTEQAGLPLLKAL